MQILDLIEKFQETKILQIVQLRERQAMFRRYAWFALSNFFGKKLFTQSLESATILSNDLERDNRNVKQNFCSCIFLLLLYFL